MKNHTFMDWWKAHKGMRWLWVDWSYYTATYSRFNPKCHKVGGLLHELWYYLKCRFWTRYNRFDVKTLPPTWQDADEKILHVCFHILGDVINKEKILEHNAEEGDPMDGQSWAWALGEMKTLWHWWTVVRPQILAESDRRLKVWHDLWERDKRAYAEKHKELWEEYEKPYGGISRWSGSIANIIQDETGDPWESDELLAATKSYGDIDDRAINRMDSEMLARLMKIRCYLWT